MRNVIKCDTIALEDLTRKRRLQFLERYPYPVGTVPSLCFVSSVVDHDDSNMKLLYKYLLFDRSIEFPMDIRARFLFYI